MAINQNNSFLSKCQQQEQRPQGNSLWLVLPREPPAESWQNSYMPSNTGQSSPTLTGAAEKTEDKANENK